VRAALCQHAWLMTGAAATPIDSKSNNSGRMTGPR
jgi:hypothetical protein